MTALTTAEIEEYYQRVCDFLADLDSAVRDDLLEDLPDHLAEVAAEGTGSMVERLGTPEAYAAELRAAAGLSSGPGQLPNHRSWVERRRRAAELLDRADVRLARPLGYPRLTELLVALRPGWWLLRGWVVAQILCGTHNRASWHGFIPDLGNSPVLGFVVLVVAVAASIWLGRRSRGWTIWPRRAVAAAGVLIAGWAVLVLAHDVGGTAYIYSYSQADNGYPDPSYTVRDVYPYDGNGNLVPGLRLFDQAGNPLRLGSATCEDGNQAPGAVDLEWTYPLCPADPGPFRAGPGALPSSSGAVSPTPSASAVSPKPSAGVVSPPATKPTPSR